MSKDGGWIQTYTGRRFYPLGPNPADVDIEDIAHSLSMQCRFLGHTREFYSVAQHSVLVSEAIETVRWLICPSPERMLELTMYGLLHDAAEAYLSDVVSPLKPFLLGFAEVETLLEVVIYDALRIKRPDDDAQVIIKSFDVQLLWREARDLMGVEDAGSGWAAHVRTMAEYPLTLSQCRSNKMDPEPLSAWPPSWAEEKFLQRFHQLQRQLGQPLKLEATPIKEAETERE